MWAARGACRHVGHHEHVTAPWTHYSHDLSKALKLDARWKFSGDTSVTVCMDEKIWEIIEDHGRLPVETSALSEDSDLYVAGMTSHASVNVMLALEDEFDVEFPDHMLKRAVFQSVASIRGALQELLVQEVA